MEQLPAEIIYNICSNLDSKTYHNLALCGSNIYNLMPNWKEAHKTKFNKCLEDINTIYYSYLGDSCFREFNGKPVMLKYRTRATEQGWRTTSTIEELIMYYPSTKKYTIRHLREIEIKKILRLQANSIKRDDDGKKINIYEISNSWFCVNDANNEHYKPQLKFHAELISESQIFSYAYE